MEVIGAFYFDRGESWMRLAAGTFEFMLEKAHDSERILC